jgi:hypothetical protein
MKVKRRHGPLPALGTLGYNHNPGQIASHDPNHVQRRQQVRYRIPGTEARPGPAIRRVSDGGRSERLCGTEWNHPPVAVEKMAEYIWELIHRPSLAGGADRHQPGICTWQTEAERNGLRGIKTESAYTIRWNRCIW